MIEIVLMAAAVAAMPVTDEATRSAILDAARAPVTETLRKPVRLEVRHLRRAGDWTFLLADMEEPSGAPLDCRGTPLAASGVQDRMSRSYMALLRQQDGRWTVVEKAIAPSNLPWASWISQTGAPQGIFPVQ